MIEKSGWLITFVVIFLAAGCSQSVGNPTCSLNEDCVSGHLCNAEGECVKKEPVSIKTTSLPDAVIGDDSYSQPLQAEDGLAPYTWSLQTAVGAQKLGWLEIDEQTGELRCAAGSAPAEAGRDLKIDVSVRDSSNGGQGETATQRFGLDIVECRADVACYEPEDEVCMSGTRECNDGVLAVQCDIGGPSTEIGHCGPDCEPCPQGANRCDGGECKCGSSPPCEAPESCCGSGCFDLDSAVNHCGDCETDCTEQVAYAAGIVCDEGSCDYAQCNTGFFDCDDDRANGCETISGPTDCSACGDECADQGAYPHTENARCIDTACVYDCQAGYADCEDGVPGCESPLGTQTHCGSCDESCGSDSAPVCIELDGGGFRCGCDTHDECPPERMCCDSRTCVNHTSENCEFCGHQCSVLEGGLECNGDIDNGWQCECSGDASCKGVYDFSKAQCRSDTNQCTCIGDTNCSGNIDNICCSTSGIYDCTDLRTDHDNCGVCGRICGVSETCGADCAGDGPCGVCSCDGGSCPNLPGEDWLCVNKLCVCTNLDGVSGLEPCPTGQFCCAGGGCCTKNCNTATQADCSNDCIFNNNVWCYWGCCENCADDSDCDLYAPANFPFGE